MVFFNYALRKLNAKIVYYGPGLCGKTTNLVWIHDHFEGGERGKMISLATEGDRTIFFDLLPLDIGSIRGMDVTLQLYTVPGQVHYNSTRQLVLRGADGVVFVGDSQRAMQSSNVDSFKNLQENLLLQGISLDGFPHVLQFNKRDLKNLVTVEELNDDLNLYSVPIFEATATEGVGVQETLEGIVKLVMRNLRQRYEGATTGTRTPGVEDPQIRVAETPLTPPPGPAEVVPPEVPESISFADEPTSVDDFPVPPEELPEPSIGEQMTASEVPPEEELPSPAFVEPLMPDDPAKTIDFSRADVAESSGGLGGGFEDEVSTGVYDVDDESAIDFDELKRLDAPEDVPEPLSVEEAPVVEGLSPEEETPVGEELPEHDLPEIELVDTVAGEALPEVPAAFDLESTDAGLKTQELSQIGGEDPMGAFDFDAPAPEMEAVPDFELDMAQPESEAEVDSVPEFEPEFEPSSEFEAGAEEEEFEVETLDPPVEVETEQVSEEPDVDRVAERVRPQNPPPDGDYIDRIEAPGPFAPDAEAPREEPEVFEALRATAEAEAEEPAPEEPPLGPAFELPPDEPAEEFIGEEPELELAEDAWEETDAQGLVAEAAAAETVEEFAAEESAEESVAQLDEEAWEEPAAEDVPPEAAADIPEEFDVEEPAEEPDTEFAEETWEEPAAEEAIGEEPVTEFSAKAGGEPTPEQLLAEVMGVGSVAATDEDLPEESTGEEAVAEAVEEESDFEAEAWEEPTEEEVVAEASTEEEPVEEFTADEAEDSPDISDEEAEAPQIEEQPDDLEAPQSDEAEEEEFEAAADAFDADVFEATSQEPVLVGSEDPWTEEELSDVYRVSEVEKAEQAAAIEAATPRAVDVQAEDNQLHLRLQGTGAIVESGQVRALDIEVPVPGSWVGNKRVTLQLRLTLTPDLEDEDDGSGSPS